MCLGTRSTTEQTNRPPPPRPSSSYGTEDTADDVARKLTQAFCPRTAEDAAAAIEVRLSLSLFLSLFLSLSRGRAASYCAAPRGHAVRLRATKKKKEGEATHPRCVTSVRV